MTPVRPRAIAGPLSTVPRSAFFPFPAHTSLPVIGVPIDSSSLAGLDSLLSTVQMPPGVPVATVAIGKSGARNAGILAAQILAISDPALSALLDAFKKDMAAEVEKKAKRLENFR